MATGFNEFNQQPLPPKIEATLDSVLRDIEHWRANKNQYPNKSIPDTIWRNIFELSKVHSLSRIKSIFGVSSNQYNLKHQQLVQASLSSIKRVENKSDKQPHAAFCEVEIGESGATVTPLPNVQHATPAAVASLKSNNNDPSSYLDLSTIIVECIRPDGHRLKIHTTTKKINEVMQAFFDGSNS